ncbi:hypothetical protein LJE86_00440 [bacterium BMS3Abin03]|nr:hypothetical protein [bacterium BMS3Abin03]MCG6959066.1 hypothetical protein [bacterium BMS3Abin03]
MKKLKNFSRCTFFLCLLIFIPFNQLPGQEKVNLSAGLGLPELLNLGIRYQLEQTQLGLSVGSFPSEDKLFCISGAVYYHFAGTSELSNRRLWYGRFGLTYLHDETDAVIDKYLYLDLRVGRDINFSVKVGMEIDAGIIFQLSKEETRKKPSGWFNLDLDFPLLPALGVCVFYRI